MPDMCTQCGKKLGWVAKGRIEYALASGRIALGSTACEAKWIAARAKP